MAQQVTERVIQINTTKAVNSIRELRAQIKQLTEVQKDLDMESEEFAEISEELTGAQVKLRNAVQGNTAAVEGSYKWYSRQLQMLKEQRKWMAEGTEEYIRATEKLSELDQKLKEMDAEIGVFSRNVGNYGNAFTGLQGSVRQAAKEFPDLTNGASAFFRSVKESIPEVISGMVELATAEAATTGATASLATAETVATGATASLAAAETVATGTTVSLTTAIRGLFATLMSWQVILVLVVSLFAEYGDEIVEWVKGLVSAEKQLNATEKAQKTLTEEIKENGLGIADVLGTYEDLRREWVAMEGDMDRQTKFILENKDAFDELGVSVNSINDAENLFVENTGAYIEALRKRAEAEAAKNLATEKYEAAIIAEMERDKINKYVPLKADYYEPPVAAPFFQFSAGSAMDISNMPGTKKGDLAINADWTKKNTEAKENRELADSLFDLADAREAEADALLESAGIKKAVEPTTSTPTAERYIAPMQEYEYRGNSTSKIDTPAFSAIDESIDQSAAIERDKARLRALVAMEGATAEERKAIEQDLQNELAMIEEMRLMANEIGLRELLNDEELTADERMAIEERLTQNQIEQAQLRVDAEKAAEAEKLALAEKTEKEKEALAKKREKAESDMYKNTSSLLKSAAEFAQEDSKEQKALSAAAILMDTYASAMAGWKAGMEVGGPIAPILAGANVAASVAMGAVQLKNLLSVAPDGANATSVAGASAPSVAGSMPAAYTRNLMGDSEITALNQDTRVYVVESDITEAQNAAKVRVESASF